MTEDQDEKQPKKISENPEEFLFDSLKRICLESNIDEDDFPEIK